MSNRDRGKQPRGIELRNPELWSGVSVFDSEERVRDVATRHGWQGFIARLDIPDGAPVRIERTTLSEGHHTLWAPADLVLDYIVSVTRVS